MPVAQDDNLQHKARGRSPSAASTPMSATFASSSGSGRSSPVSTNKSMRDRRLQGSIDNASFHSHAASSDLGHPWEPSTPVPVPPAGLINRQLGSTPDVHDAISLAEDTLLSIIAAFIGHIHSHHIGSHPSSHAHLIEMTRETIDAVRELLTIVEAVGRNVGVRLSRPRDIENLRQAKDGLYDVASRLVEGAEEVANAPFSETGEDASDSEKARLLQTATGTLRAGTECVRLVKLCLPDEDTLNIQNTPRQSDEHAHQSTPRPAQDAAVVSRDKVVDIRGEHTLSALDRTATNLSKLQKRYLEDESQDQGPTEDVEAGDEEIVQDQSREEEMTLQSVDLVSAGSAKVSSDGNSSALQCCKRPHRRPCRWLSWAAMGCLEVSPTVAAGFREVGRLAYLHRHRHLAFSIARVRVQLISTDSQVIKKGRRGLQVSFRPPRRRSVSAL